MWRCSKGMKSNEEEEFKDDEGKQMSLAFTAPFFQQVKKNTIFL